MAGKNLDWRPGPSVCRCCFAEGCYKDISTEYFWMGKREVYSEMLNETFDVSIAYSQSGGPNSNSRLICEPCISRLRDASDFKRQVLECEKTFMHHLDPGSSSAMELEVEVEQMDKEVKLERVKLERKMSEDDFDDNVGFGDDDDDDDLDDQPLTKLATKVPKKESVDVLETLLDTAKAEKRKSTIKVKVTPAKKPKKKEIVVKASASKTAAKPEKKKKDTAREREADTVKQNSLIILKNSTAYPFKQERTMIRCFFCRSRFQDPRMFRSHMDFSHENVDRSLSVVLRLDRGSLLRVDITVLRCKCSQTIFPTLDSLAEHLISEHHFQIDMNQSLGLVPLKLDGDHYECFICLKKFTGLTQLSKHAGTHFTSRHICESCGKQYETRSGLVEHEKTHNPAYMANPFKCRVCKKTFPTIAERKEHKYTNKSCMHLLKCQICGERFPSWDRRQEHLVQVHGKPQQLFPCTECDATFFKRAMLYTHFKGTHTKDNKCEFCDATFAMKQSLEEHIRRHTGERPYKCTVCDKSFRDKHTLKNHEITHDDSKKLGCLVCGRLFVVKSRLRSHVEKHHPGYYEQFPESTEIEVPVIN